MTINVIFNAQTLNNQEVTIDLRGLTYIAKVNEDTTDDDRVFYIIETFYLGGRMSKLPIFKEDYERLKEEHKKVLEFSAENTDWYQSQATSALVAEEVTKIMEKTTDYVNQVQDNFTSNLLKVHDEFNTRVEGRTSEMLTELQERIDNVKAMESKLAKIHGFVEQFVGSVDEMEEVVAETAKELESEEAGA